MPRGKYDHYKIRGRQLDHIASCNCSVCKVKRREAHKYTCRCAICRAKRGDNPKHPENCGCSVCKVKRNEYVHKEGCKCASCISKRGERICKEQCQCATCLMKRFHKRQSKFKTRSDKGKRRGYFRKENLGLKTALLWKGQEYRRHMSIVHTGFKQSKEQIAKRVAKMSGVNHPNWKGGITRSNAKGRRVPEYLRWRKAILKRDGYACTRCGNKDVKLEADHIKPYALYPELRVSMDNGRALCVPCHRKTETYGGRTRRGKNNI